jgi:hypothetical protein
MLMGVMRVQRDSSTTVRTCTDMSALLTSVVKIGRQNGVHVTVSYTAMSEMNKADASLPFFSMVSKRNRSVLHGVKRNGRSSSRECIFQ